MQNTITPEKRGFISYLNEARRKRSGFEITSGWRTFLSEYCVSSYLLFTGLIYCAIRTMPDRNSGVNNTNFLWIYHPWCNLASHHLQNIFVIYHRRKKIVQVWKTWGQVNDDIIEIFFLVNYGFIQKAVCTNRSLQMVPRVLGCYATFLLPDKKKCAWFWWMCTCSII